jgi:hypothetical protein
MTDEHIDDKPAWIDASAQAAPLLLGASAGLLLGDMMHHNARRTVGIGLGVLAIASLLPYVADGVAGLITGPKSKVGVRRKIQRIRDAGIGSPTVDDDVEEQLRMQGLL